MSKLGIHVSSGDRHGFGDLLRTCANAGSPVPVIFSVGQDVWPDVQRYSPPTKVVYRHKPDGLDAPGSTYHGDAIQTAHDWMALCMPNWAKNKADYYAPLNEQDAGDIEGYKWLNAFSLECMKIAEANGYRLALYAFSGGNPRDGATDLDRTTLEDKWGVLVPSLQAAKANNHILLLHEYGFGSPAIRDGQGNLVAPASTLRASAPNLALRYRRSLHYLTRFNADPLLVISEASAGVGGYSSIGLDVWLTDAEWYDSELMKDRNVIGCCLYQAGGAENIKGAFPRLGDYISRTPTPAVPLSGDDPAIFDPSVYVIPLPTLPNTYPTGGVEPVPTDPIDSVPIPIGEPVTTPPAPIEPVTPPITPPPSTGPLDFTVTVINCRNNPAQREGIIVTFQFNATGGSGEYTYLHDGQPLPGPVFERLATRSGKIIDGFGVTSSDGQTATKKLFFSPKDMDCR